VLARSPRALLGRSCRGVRQGEAPRAEAVLAAGEAESGCTVHLVSERYDDGPILAQVRVPVLDGDTPDTLAARVQAEERRLYPTVAAAFVREQLEG